MEVGRVREIGQSMAFCIMKTEYLQKLRDFLFRLLHCKGWQSPVSCDDDPAASAVACEGYEQRAVPTGVASGGNE